MTRHADNEGMSERGRDEHVPDDDELRALLGEDVASSFDELAVDGHGVLRNITDWRFDRAEAPGPITPVHILDVPPAVRGRRLISVDPESGRTRYDLRAASDVFEDSEGQWVKVVEEWRYFVWLVMSETSRPAVCPRAKAYPLVNLWVDPTT
jgi:hypothetical protein